MFKFLKDILCDLLYVIMIITLAFPASIISNTLVSLFICWVALTKGWQYADALCKLKYGVKK